MRGWVRGGAILVASIAAMLGAAPLDTAAWRSELAKRIMSAADKGERDPRRLKLIALRAIDA